LAQILKDPIADLLPRNPAETVIFVPDQSFLSVAFASLPHPAGGTLIDQHAMMVAPSIQVLERIRRRKQWRPSLPSGALVVGNPDRSLGFAEGEARAIAGMLGVTPLIGAEATKKRVLEEMPRHRILHFATHGELNDEGIASAVILAPDTEGHVTLGIDEILGLDLNADLVVLSACSTGRGKETVDGVIGLSRALLGAGAASVLVALWPVPDYPTSVLMTAFYEDYLARHDKIEALRQGMIAARVVDSNPLSWAAFSLIGDQYST
jgi:CHAT domain-containing protein